MIVDSEQIERQVEPLVERRLQGERRSYPRFRVAAPHELKIAFGALGCRPLRGVAIDISCGGMRIKFERGEWARKKGAACFVRFLDVPDQLEPQAAIGVVRRVGDAPDHSFAAIEFTESLAFLDLSGRARRQRARRRRDQSGGSSESRSSSNSMASS